MYFRIIRNDISKSKWITLTTMIFVAAAAMLVSLTAILSINLSGSIDTLMKQAKTPHFMQMHSGDIDTSRIANFASEYRNVESFQVLEFLNVENAQIIINDQSLGDSVQDNGFSTQSEKFDFLLDLDGNIIQPSAGEIYVPTGYMKDGTAKIGDNVVINGKKLTVAGFLRDSQMNAMLASSKRFLVSEQDYAELKQFGSIEYLIEFRLKDLSKLSSFESAYASADLDANGPTITYPLFKMINAVSDGLMIAVILLISMLVVIITFMCIRFTLLAKIEDDYREIGVMKAIGLRISDIKKIYLAKYMFISAIGCMLGFSLSFVFKEKLLENIRLNMGESEHSSLALLVGIIGIVIVFLTITLYVNRVLKRFRSISAVEAIRFGASKEKSTGAKHFSLNQNRMLNTNVFLGIKDVFARKSMYLTMLLVLVISIFIIIVPHNLYNTISAKSFTTYMGIGNSDIRIDIQQTENISQKAADIANRMEQDTSISKYAVLSTRAFKVKTEQGTEETIKIELGDHEIFPVDYSVGKAPISKDEIALSTIHADELSKKVGDRLILVIDGKEKKFKVCGIYSDVTNGGKTAKAAFTNQSAEMMWSIIYANLSNQDSIEQVITDYTNEFAYAKVSSIDEYITQTFGSTISSIGKASIIAVVIAVVIAMLITLLFMKMLIAKDRYSIALMKSIGFTNKDIMAQYVSRAIFVLTMGIVVGTILANTLGEVLAGMLIASFGASTFEFVVDPLASYVLYPLMMIVTVLIATILGTARAGRIKISENIKE